MLTETLGFSRLTIALAMPVLVLFIGYLVTRAVGSTTDGVLTLSAFALFWTVLVLLPADLPLEMRSASLLVVLVRPPRGELGPVPLVTRLAAAVGMVVAASPVALSLLLASDGPKFLDDVGLTVGRWFVPVAFVWYLWERWRDSRR